LGLKGEGAALFDGRGGGGKRGGVRRSGSTEAKAWARVYKVRNGARGPKMEGGNGREKGSD